MSELHTHVHTTPRRSPRKRKPCATPPHPTHLTPSKMRKTDVEADLEDDLMMLQFAEKMAKEGL